MRATEHILLESDERKVPALRTARKVHSRLRIQSKVRRRACELALIDYYYLSVRTWRSRRPVSQHVLDLRFVDPALRLSRHVARRSMIASAALAALAVVLAWWIGASSTPWWQHEWLPVLGGLSGLAVCAALVSLCRTTETLTLFSVCGRARLLELTGGGGSFEHPELQAGAGRACEDSRSRDAGCRAPNICATRCASTFVSRRPGCCRRRSTRSARRASWRSTLEDRH